MKIKVIFLAVVLMVLPLKAEEVVSVQTLDLESSLDLAFKNNSRLLSVEQDLIIAQTKVKEATFRFFPQVSFAGTITKSDLKYPVVFTEDFTNHYLAPSSFENFYTAKMSVVQTLYVGGRNRNTLRLAKASLKQAQTEYDKIKREVELNLKKAYFDFLYAKKFYQTSSEWNGRIKSILKKIKLNQWQKIEVKNIERKFAYNLELAKNEIKQTKLRFIKALNKELDSEIDIVGAFEPNITELELEKAVFWAMELRAELRSQVYKAEMDAISLNLAMSRKAPTVLLGGTYDFVGNKFPLDKNSWYTTLAIQFPLSLDLWTQIKQRRAEIRQGDIKRSAMQDEVKLQVRCAYNDLMFWQQQVRKNYEFFKELKSGFEYLVKRRSLNIDTVKSGLSVYEAQVKYIQSVKNQLNGRAETEWVLGCKIPCR